VFISAALTACSPSGGEGQDTQPVQVTAAPGTASVSVAAFGTTSAGEAVSLYTLTNRNGMTVSISNYGGVLTGLTAPDRNGVYQNVVPGYGSLAEYEADRSYTGALLGRFANRIAGARFTLLGEEHMLTINDAPHHLNGGRAGFHKVLWAAEPIERDDGVGLRLSHVSPDGDEGYPGELSVDVRYFLANDDSLYINYEAATDKPTPVNISSHHCFDLSGGARRDILDHRLQIQAESFTPVDAGLIPTGDLAPVEGTPFDFRKPRPVGENIASGDEQLRRAGGYDHNFVLDPQAVDGESPAVRLSDPESGRVLEIYTSEPGVQFRLAGLPGEQAAEAGAENGAHAGLCLLTQHFPDSPNQSQFPPTMVWPGHPYRSWTRYVLTAGQEP
jgi:aldose 1-epimerase